MNKSYDWEYAKGHVNPEVFWNANDIKNFSHDQESKNKLVDWACKRDLKNIDIQYYKMIPGSNNSDQKTNHENYIKTYGLQNNTDAIYHFIFFIENRMSGQILEIYNRLIDWKAGDYVAYKHGTPYISANLGLNDRYTIELTGVVVDC